MSESEKLERVGWSFIINFGISTEVYGRGTCRILYDTVKNQCYGWFRTDSKELLSEPDSYQLELFFEKEL